MKVDKRHGARNSPIPCDPVSTLFAPTSTSTAVAHPLDPGLAPLADEHIPLLPRILLAAVQLRVLREHRPDLARVGVPQRVVDYDKDRRVRSCLS